jgi:hypothetical protein
MVPIHFFYGFQLMLKKKKDKANLELRQRNIGING